MYCKKNLSSPICTAFAVLIMMFLAACGSNATNIPAETQPAPTIVQGQIKPTKLPQKTKTPLPTKTLLPTSTNVPVVKPTVGPLGLSRSNPYPRSTVVSAPNWDIQVLEVKRGDAAWKDIYAADPFNEAAPDGMEYLAVKLHVKSTYTDSDEHSLDSCDFGVTGDHLINYTCGMAAELPPSLDASLSSGEEAEGWVTYLVAQGEKNLILVFQESANDDENAVRYIALDEGASISISPELANIKPGDLGKTSDTPVPVGQALTTQDWILTVNEVVRGEDAWTMVQEANQFNDPPAKGMEYIAVKIHVRYIASADKAASMDGSYFNSIGSAGVLYEYPSLQPPDPALDVSLFPGGEYEGWVVVQAATGETGVMLVFNPSVDGGEANRHFMSLEP